MSRSRSFLPPLVRRSQELHTPPYLRCHFVRPHHSIYFWLNSSLSYSWASIDNTQVDNSKLYKRFVSSRPLLRFFDSKTLADWPSSCLTNRTKNMAVNQPSFVLDDVEKTMSKLLLAVGKYIEESAPDSKVNSSPIVLRFTGGWVRDKILGIPSHDIDVAINNMTGYQFGLKLHEYLSVHGKAEEHGLPPMGKLHKIEANPDKSKHLETTTTRILGLDIDLVNLRKEIYAEDSRNPQMEFGTAEEDALRRDATVNALFYNLNTGEVEDLTNRGMDDMAGKIIRTPLAPLQTFRDDPLRVLRLIRFATRLSFKIEDECFQGMKNEDIKGALHQKISRERVGTEVTKMLQGENPHEALRLIDEAGLYNTIFSPLSIKSDPKPDFSGWKTTYDFCNTLSQNQEAPELSSLVQFLLQDENDFFLLWTIASIIPWVNAAPLPPSKFGKASPPVAYYVLAEGIKSPNKVTDVITAAFQHLDEIRSIKESCHAASKSSMVDKDLTSRERIGMAMRRWGSSWRNQIVFALLFEVSQKDRSIQTIVESYQSLNSKIGTYGLEEVCDLKRVMDGGFLAKSLGIKPGPWMKDALDVVVAWQLRNPDMIDTPAILEEVKTWKTNLDSTAAARPSPSGGKITSELISNLISHFLRGPIRSLFAKPSTHGITPQGNRKHEPTVPAGRQRNLNSFADMDGIETPGWKVNGGGVDGYEFSLLKWVVRNLNSTLTERNWALLLPPILTVLEDYEVAYKTIGCECLHALLVNVPPPHLIRTGLSPLFFQQLTHCLSYLPELTPADQSRDLISQAFQALLALSNVLAKSETAMTTIPSQSSIATKPTVGKEEPLTSRSILLSSLSSGVIAPFAHVGSNHAQIMTVCLTHGGIAVSRLGIDVIPLMNTLITKVVSPILRDPFLSAFTPLICATTEFTNQIVLAGWPRIPAYRNVLTMTLLTIFARVRSEVDEAMKEKRTATVIRGPKIQEIGEFDNVNEPEVGIRKLTPLEKERIDKLRGSQRDVAKTVKLLVHVVDHYVDSQGEEETGENAEESTDKNGDSTSEKTDSKLSVELAELAKTSEGVANLLEMMKDVK